MTPEVGEKAPDFTLPNQDREPVRLSEALASGPVVLAFFPAAFSSTCTKEMCTFRDTLGRMGGPKMSVFGVSVDTFWTLKAYRSEHRLPFPLPSDFNKDVIRQYGVFNENMIGLKGIAKRAVFLIDRGGTVRYKEVVEDARNEPDYEKLAKAIEEVGDLGARDQGLGTGAGD